VGYMYASTIALFLCRICEMICFANGFFKAANGDYTQFNPAYFAFGMAIWCSLNLGLS
jgi:hypothetical protein